MPEDAPAPDKPPRHRDHLFRRLQWQELDPGYLRQLIRIAREEDLEGAGLLSAPAMPGDATTRALGADQKAKARIVTRQELTVCGQGLVPLVLEIYADGQAPLYEPAIPDGKNVAPGNCLGEIRGSAATILRAERILLNFLQHLSGVAAQTQRFVDALGWSHTRLLDTRKTTPGFRVLEKYAVACGGGWNHRIGLFDRAMLKDNHLAATATLQGQALADAVRRVRGKNPVLPLEVEVDQLDQIEPILQAGADVILLDNFPTEEMVEAVSLIGNKAYTEASGTITLDQLPTLAGLGLDFISTGALIHQSTWRDIGLDWA